MANYRRVASSPLFTIRLLALLTAASGLLSVRSAAAAATVSTTAEVRHVRHKRTVSDFMENIMNAVYSRMQDHDDDDDDNDNALPLPSTVIARFTHMPTSGKVYKWVDPGILFPPPPWNFYPGNYPKRFSDQRLELYVF